MLTFLLILFWATIYGANSKPYQENINCGYQSCVPTKDGYVNIHLVAHTHDDVGWLKTVDQYYEGTETRITRDCVKCILTTLIPSLEKNPDRKFIYVETAYFWMWWKEQSLETKELVKKFVNNGQLEFIGGAWSMNDEATTNYQSIIDQFTWGHRKLEDLFGKCGRPKIGWQIDPFGHSREMASIFSQLGFDGIFLGRIDYQEIDFRWKTNTAEMVWKSSNNLGSSSNIFTGILPNLYQNPAGYCWDIECSDAEIIDDPNSASNNVNARVEGFIAFVNRQAEKYKTKNILVTMGGDFNYKNSEKYFRNMDKLIKHTNLKQSEHFKYNMMYSTPSCYLKAVHDEAQKTGMKLPVKQDDFFPYCTVKEGCWTGYFTSKPTIKYSERLGNNYLQISKQLSALAHTDEYFYVKIDSLKEIMGVLQHHDAITGTEKEHVAHDYMKTFYESITESEAVVSEALRKLSNIDVNSEVSFSSCLLANISSCKFTEDNDNFVVTIYNPLSRTVSKHVRLPVKGSSYNVKDPNGNSLVVQMLPILEAVKNIPGRSSSAQAEMVFVASEIPPMGFKTYFVTKLKNDMLLETTSFLGIHDVNNVKFKILGETGKLTSIIVGDRELPIKQDLVFYKSSSDFRSSGAYIFSPQGENTEIIEETVDTQIYEGELVSEIHQRYNNWTSQIIRIYNDEEYVEFDWVVGPLPAQGLEVVNKFVTNIKNDGIFYTDSNGRELMKRIRNFRPTWSLKKPKPVSSDYYPVTSRILIRDEDLNIEVAVLNDRAQGGTSYNDGEIELMIHRNSHRDDFLGVGEPLNEQAFGKGIVVRGSHYLMAGSISQDPENILEKTLAAKERELVIKKLLSAWTFLSSTENLSFEEYYNNHKLEFSGLTRSLPENVNILTLEPWKDNTMILRLEHILEYNEDPTLSLPVRINLKGLFTLFEIKTMQEMTLSANQLLKDNQRMQFESGNKIEDLVERTSEAETENLKKWETNDISETDIPSEICDDLDNLEITLTPMQIRTFIIEVEHTL